MLVNPYTLQVNPVKLLWPWQAATAAATVMGVDGRLGRITAPLQINQFRQVRPNERVNRSVISGTKEKIKEA